MTPNTSNMPPVPQVPAAGPAHGPHDKPHRFFTLGKMIPLVLMIAGIGAVAAIMNMPKNEPPPPPPPDTTTPVEVLKIAPAAVVDDIVELPGFVEPNRIVKVAAEVSGQIQKVFSTEGSPVKQNDALVQLDTELLAVECDRCKSQSEFDQRECDRVADLQKRGVATANEVDSMRTKAAISKAMFTQADTHLKKAHIVAPISGTLNRLPMEAGEYVQPGQTVAEIVDMDTVKVVVDVPEKDIHRLRVGECQDVHLSADKKVCGTVRYISELADSSTRTTRVELTVDNKDRGLHTGQIVRVGVSRGRVNNAIMVPLSAVIPLEKTKRIFVACKEDGKLIARDRDVKLGFMRGFQVLITEGLAEGDMLILAPSNRYVATGKPVKFAVAGAETRPAGSPSASAPVAEPASKPSGSAL